MSLEIKAIGLGGVNCYLIRSGDGFALVDTGFRKDRAGIEQALLDAGCRQGDLKLILLTHGDFDHTGNAAYLRGKYGAKIGIHRAEAGAVEVGDMLLSRKSRPLLARLVLAFFRLRKSDRFTADLFLEDGQDLAEHGLAARVIHLPGHSLGSIGILTAEGDVFCGDLLTNHDRPLLNTIIDDLPEARASLEKLKRPEVVAIYPGHGQPFAAGALRSAAPASTA